MDNSEEENTQRNTLGNTQLLGCVFTREPSWENCVKQRRHHCASTFSLTCIVSKKRRHRSVPLFYLILCTDPDGLIPSKLCRKTGSGPISLHSEFFQSDSFEARNFLRRHSSLPAQWCDFRFSAIRNCPPPHWPWCTHHTTAVPTIRFALSTIRFCELPTP